MFIDDVSDPKTIGSETTYKSAILITSSIHMQIDICDYKEENTKLPIQVNLLTFV